MKLQTKLGIIRPLKFIAQKDNNKYKYLKLDSWYENIMFMCKGIPIEYILQNNKRRLPMSYKVIQKSMFVINKRRVN